jgi:hypothetical protein
MPAFRSIPSLLLTSLALAGCQSCRNTAAAPDASALAPPSIAPADFPPAPSEWRFRPARGIQNLALPTGCTTRAPLVEAPVGSPVRFLGEPRSLGTLIAAEASGMPLRLTAAGVIHLEPEGASHDPVRLPWTTVGAMPRLARAKSGWIGGLDRSTGEEGVPSHVALWRGEATEDLGAGDAFETIDLACGDDRCALLTSRKLAATRPGAEVWFGRRDEPASTWKAVTIEPTRQGDLSDAHGVAIARIDAPLFATDAGSSGDAGAKSADAGAKSGDAGAALLAPPIVVVTQEIGEAVFFGLGDAQGVRELARLAAPNGVLDAIARPNPMALVYASAINDEGCAPEGGKLELARADLPSIPINVPAPPNTGYIRRLAKGYLATWMAPLGCHQARRVVYAVVLDAEGKPISDVMPIGDATPPAGSKQPPTYAVASEGADVDLWIQNGGLVSWIRARCEAP